MKIAEAREQGFAQFAENRDQNLKRIQYLQYLADNAKVKIGDWDLDLFLEGGEVVDKPEINKRFFAAAPTNRILTTATKLDQAVLEQLIEIAERSTAEAISRHERNAQLNQSQADELYRQCRQILTRAQVEYDKAAALRGTPCTLKAQFEAILTGDFYHYHSYRAHEHRLNLTTPLITLTHKTPNVDITVHLGRYRVALDLAQANLTIHRHERNLTTPNGSIHPFMQNGEAPCFGSAQGQANEHLAKREYQKLLELLQQLFTTYSHDNRPFATLEQFYQLQESDTERKRANHLRATAPTVSPSAAIGAAHGANAGMALMNEHIRRTAAAFTEEGDSYIISHSWEPTVGVMPITSSPIIFTRDR